MNEHDIIFDKIFLNELKSLPAPIQRKSRKTFHLFRHNPFHPSLRLHKLSGNLDGLWSVSVDRRYRIMMRFVGNGDAVFLSIGTHAIYDT